MAYQLTSLGISVLALLREQPMHGYEMFQTLIARHEDRIVKVRPGSLYHVVYRLAEENLIRPGAIGRDGNRPERTIFEITAVGTAALAQRVQELVAAPVDEFPQFVVALAEIHNLDRVTALGAIRSRIAALDTSVVEIRTLRDASSAEAIYLVALDYVLATTRAKLEWLREFAESVESGRLQWLHTPAPATVGATRREVTI